MTIVTNRTPITLRVTGGGVGDGDKVTVEMFSSTFQSSTTFSPDEAREIAAVILAAADAAELRPALQLVPAGNRSP